MHSCEDMILMCIWKGKAINCSEIFEIRQTDNGFCCSFNSLKISELYRNSASLNKTLTSDDMDEFYDEYSSDEDNHEYFWSSGKSVYGCGGTITESTGTLTSPDDMELLQCEWVIRSSPLNRIHLHFQQFGVQNFDVKRYECLDYVAIYDGGSPKFPLLGRYCGNIIPPDHFSSGNQLLIRYRSENNKGFRLIYQTFPKNGSINNSIYRGKLLNLRVITQENIEFSQNIYYYPSLGL